MSIREFALLILICAIWGLHFVVMRHVIFTLDVPPVFYAALRISILGVLLSPLLRWHTGQMRYVLIGGLGFGAFNYAFLFPALEMTTASAAAIAIELYMPFSIILSVLILGERIGWWRISGATLAFAGVVIIGLGAPSESREAGFALGIVLIALAAFSEACGAVAVKSVKDIGPLRLLAWFGVVGSLVLWPLTFILEDGQEIIFDPEIRGTFALALLYSVGLVSLVAHGTYYWLLQRLPIHTVAPSGLLTTVIGVAGGALILGEPLTRTLLIGAAVTLTGIAIILWRNRKKALPLITEVS